ncbi:hypothetical protein MIR68_009251 [Amoeboaphelidium protococcarum]|nr:hypothetical protein MIR68_009251 [Amoeboaphelidium protococcarum]
MNYLKTLTELSPLITLLGSGAGIFCLSSSGLLPRAGPLRALIFAFRSKLRSPRLPISNRTADLTILRNALEVVDRQKYVVVIGQKGIGKSVLVHTVTNRAFGVVEKEVKPGMDQDAIINAVLRDVANVNYGPWNPRSNAARVLWWYRRFAISPPIAVLNATERSPGEAYAGLTGAVRTLKEKYGLRVIVDGSPNSLPPSLLSTERQRVLVIQPMDWETVQKLEQCKPALEWINSAGLEKAVWAVLGGVPAKYDRLVNVIMESKLDPSKDLRVVIGDFLVDEVKKAMKSVTEATEAFPDMKKILELLDAELKVPRKALAENNLQRPILDEILREIERDGKFVLVPASGAISLVLRHKLSNAPSLDELLKLVGQQLELQHKCWRLAEDQCTLPQLSSESQQSYDIDAEKKIQKRRYRNPGLCLQQNFLFNFAMGDTADSNIAVQ